MKMIEKIAIIGGGAAGFFAAVNLADLAEQRGRSVAITIYEATGELLHKVAISGGGRCNLTNSFKNYSIKEAYPRGANVIKKGFKEFDYRQTYDWFEANGVELVTQEDGCVFPNSQDAQEIRTLLMQMANQRQIVIKLRHRVSQIEKCKDSYRLYFKQGEDVFDKVVVAVGGCRGSIEEVLGELGEVVVKPLPSLFGFRTQDNFIKLLSGIVVDKVGVVLQGTKLKSSGALLITHQGLSGPAILKMSSYAARILDEMGYECKISINWVCQSEVVVREELEAIVKEHSKKLLINYRPFDLTSRLWLLLLDRASVSKERKWGELGAKGINRLINILTNDEYQIIGRTSHQEEFVTCGGVSLEGVDISSLESKKNKGLYFAGEILDIDAITGGFNLQAAWTTGMIVAKAIV